MKITFTGIALTLCAVLSGCAKGTPGGPGTTQEQPTFGQADNTFNLTVPVLSAALQPGATSEATIEIQRAKNFDEDVTLKFTDLPQGVTVEPASPVIKHGDASTKITFRVGDNVPVGEYKVKVLGHPARGSDAQVDFNLKIAANDSFKLSLPRLSDLKQGETQTVSVEIKRNGTFDQDVSLNFGEMPQGISLDPSTPVIRRGQAATQVAVTAADDAALGNFVLRVTGHPGKGADASGDLRLTVVQK